MKLIVAAFALAAVQAFAQAGPGGPGPMCQEKDSPPGCKMMSNDEMKAHHQKMHGMTNKNSCMAYMDEHHRTMKERAAKTGESFPDKPGYGRCEKLK